MKVSVITTAYRPGGLDITLAGMRDQSYKNFEVIIVDKRYNKRHIDVMKLAKQYNLHNVIHVPEHRMNGKWNTFCSAWNTGMALATGDIFIFLCDWMYVHPGWIETHIKAHEVANRYVLAPYVYTELPELTKPYLQDKELQRQRGDRCTEPDDVLNGEVMDEMFTFKNGPFDPQWIPGLAVSPHPHQDARSIHQPGAKELNLPRDNTGWIHIKHESLTKELAYQLNGLDERLERGKGPMDTDFEARLALAGLSLWWEPAISPGICPNPRWYCRSMPWGDMHERLEGRWSYDDGLVYIERRKLEIRAAQTVEEKSKIIQSKNQYTLQGLSQRLASWRTDPNPQPIDVDDLTYWGKEIWPDTSDENKIETIEWPSQKSSSICRTCLQNTFVELGAKTQPSYHPNIHSELTQGVDWIWGLEQGSLPFHNEHADRIKTINYLDTLSQQSVEALLKECYRVLKMSGVLFIQLTDFDAVAKDPDVLVSKFSYLKSNFTKNTLTILLKRIGFRHIAFAGKPTEFDFRINAVK